MITSKEPMLSGGLVTPKTLDAHLKVFNDHLEALPAALFTHMPLGITWLDNALYGGINAQDVMLIIGKQNVGKTTLLLQMARHMAKWAKENNYPIAPFLVCFEHDEWDLFTRLLCQESYLCDPNKPLEYGVIRQTIRKIKEELDAPDAVPTDRQFIDLLFSALPPIGIQAAAEIGSYSSRVIFWYGDSTYTTVQVIKEVITHYAENGLYLVPFIDYLQTIPPPIRLIEASITNHDVVIGANLSEIRSMAVTQHVPSILVAALDDDVLRENRPGHIEDIYGPIQTKYTPDIGLVLNPDILSLDSVSSLDRRTKIRISLEKNRKGPSELEWRHERFGGHFFFDPKGEKVPFGESYQITRVRHEKLVHEEKTHK